MDTKEYKVISALLGVTVIMLFILVLLLDKRESRLISRIQECKSPVQEIIMDPVQLDDGYTSNLEEAIFDAQVKEIFMTKTIEGKDREIERLKGLLKGTK